MNNKEMMILKDLHMGVLTVKLSCNVQKLTVIDLAEWYEILSVYTR